GVRVYTYIWTMVLAMRACKQNGVKVVILDRPNPLDGITIEGNMLEMPFISFVGLHPLPMRHGMTIGELARYASRFWDAGEEPTIIACEGWMRTMSLAQTGLPWVFPSPNLATLDTLAVYPGFVLFEGTQLSEGRGTVRPFELFGHPAMKSNAWTERINKALQYAAHEVAALENASQLNAATNHSEHRNQGLKNAAHENVAHGVAAHHNASREISAPDTTSPVNTGLLGYKVRPHVFVPTFEKWEGQTCYGYQIHRMDAGRSGSWMAAQVIMRELYALMGEDFVWRPPPFEYENDNMPIDILNGTDRIRRWIENQGNVSELHEIALAGRDVFLKQRQEVLLYS
ncbi:MAG: DUF1343 domain-containing protein, partial [Balneolales bacterium]|nr:DUF1343 domain-containing protein [Balneolales bacterium]